MNSDFQKKKQWLVEHKACDACLGRQFHGAFIGDNALIGRAVRNSKSLEEAKKKMKSTKKAKPVLSKDCKFCQGLFLKVDQTGDKVCELIQNLDFNSFLIGVRIPQALVTREEEMWSKVGAKNCEPLKKDLKRKIGMRVEEKLGKTVEFKTPDVTVLVDFNNEPPRLKMDVNPLFLYGEYSKLVRGIPQTHWHCRDCGGRGCEKCGFTGKMYEESVEELVAKTIVEEAGAEGEKFHGSGREDIDAKMKGWRPFVLELEKPVNRTFNFKKLEKKVNEKAGGKIKVKALRISNKEEVRFLKAVKHDKVYELVVECEKKPSSKKLKELEKEFSGVTIAQQTPNRVLHRRSDLTRKREVKKTKCSVLKGKKFKAEVTAEAGTYVKELVSGDDGRTKPSFSEFLGNCKVIELNVLKVLGKRGLERFKE
jgi:tRNA pseudouridine synthase 10